MSTLQNKMPEDFLLAILENNEQEIQLMLGKHPELIHMKWENGNTALHLVCKSSRGHQDTLKLLLRFGPNVNELNDRNETPLLAVASHPSERDFDLEAIKLLVAAGAHLNQMDKRGMAALHWACLMKPFDMIKLLVESGADTGLYKIGKEQLSALDLAKRYPMHPEERISYLEAVELVRSERAQLEEQCQRGPEKVDSPEKDRVIKLGRL